MTDPVWCVMPVLAGPEMTEAALSDLLAQSVPVRVLIINQGVDDAFRDRLERLAEQDHRIFVWHHQPPLPSLSASWNLALDTIWHSGGKVALVVNNDVRLRPEMIAVLHDELVRQDALFVSAVGVAEADWRPGTVWDPRPLSDHGGPDFSCFMISRTCHQNYRFDERFIPAFCEDLDYHRRLLLGGDGSRIFSVNLPYLHLASQTLKGGYLPEAEVARIQRAIETQSRAYYAKKWGGPVNEERLQAPFGEDGVSGYNLGQATTPMLQRRVAAGLPPIGCPRHDDQPIDTCPICAREQQAWVDSQLEASPVRSWDEQNERAWEDLAIHWADSNHQEDARGEDGRRAEPAGGDDPAGDNPGST
jgi:hypothetical protein